MTPRVPLRCAASAASLALVTSIALAGCTGSGDGDFCDVLLDDMAAAATVFTSPSTQIGDVEAMQARIDLLGQIEDPPEELAAPLASWIDWLADLHETWEADPSDVSAAVDSDDAVDAARDQLFDYYIDVCME